MSHHPTAEDNPPASPGSDLDPTITYRPISTAAVAALILGLASPLAIAWSVFWVVPLLGVLVAAIALRGITLSDGALAGRWAAITGLTLSLTLGAMVVTSHWARQRIVAAQGTPWGLKWCELLLQGKAAEALELKQEPMTRRPLSTLEQYYKNNDAAKARLAEFSEEPLIKTLLSAPPGSTIEPGPVDSVSRAARGGYILVRAFTLFPGKTEGVSTEGYDEPLVFSLQIRKAPKRGPIEGVWYVEAYRIGRLADAVAP